jgi:hypothetical protein
MTDHSSAIAAPCGLCSGRDYYWIEKWQASNPEFTNAVMAVEIAGAKTPEGWLAVAERVTVPISLRVCGNCGATQLFANPTPLARLQKHVPNEVTFHPATQSHTYR